MKHLILSMAIIALLTTSCKKDKPKGGDAQEVTSVSTETTVNYALDTAQSSVKWRGYKISDGTEDGHYGTVAFSSNGQFSVADSVLTSGSFEINMSSITVTDIDEEGGKSKLEIHLKDGDFFDTGKYPSANFVITKASPVSEGDYNTEIEGNFTIKDQTKSYKFLANTSQTDSTYTISTKEFDINRQEFGITYQSSMKDVILKDNITLQIMAVGNKQ